MKRSRELPVLLKRDGEREAFDFAKLSRSVAAALSASGYDPRCAPPLCRAVSLHLEQWRDPRPPTTEYVYRCVRTVLNETGLEDVADGFAAYRRRREALRRGVKVLSSRRNVNGPTSWEKGRIARLLVRRYDLTAVTARILAGDIERRVLAIGHSVVSAALVTELIRNELMAWGLAPESGGGVPAPATASDDAVAKQNASGQE